MMAKDLDIFWKEKHQGQILMQTIKYLVKSVYQRWLMRLSTAVSQSTFILNG